MADSEFRARIAETTEQLKQARQQLHSILASMQQFATKMEAASVDWEARYIAEGVREMERVANNEPETPS